MATEPAHERPVGIQTLFVMQGQLTAMAPDDVIVACDGKLNITRGIASLLGPTVQGDGDWHPPGNVRIR